jgi:AGZA family xanthine/uracil permease-like MFS transporter
MTALSASPSLLGFKPKLWVPGDWNAFFGFGTNILVNLLTLTGLLKFVLKMPDDIIFKRILPATGLMLFLSTVYYAWLAYRVAKRTGRTDVCALPSGISVPHMFIVVFVIMGPIARDHGPVKGWEAGLTWVFIQSFVLMAGGFVAPLIRKITPRAALLGTLAGVAVTFISMKPALEMFLNPVIGIVCFAIILASWFGGVRYGKIPAGLVAILVGTAIAWGSNLVGLNFGGLSGAKVVESIKGFGFAVPLPAFDHVFGGFQFLGIILVTAIPFGIYDLVEALDNVESAAVAGDDFPTTQVLTADGVVSLIGCCMGNPFINAVYIGHPGWKAMGGRVGYSAATGVMVLILACLGILPVLLEVIPTVAIYPILLYIGMLIGSQAFQETPRSHGPAIVLALIPHMAHWGATVIENSLAAVGTIVPALSPAQYADLVANMRQNGVLFQGMQVLGGGSVLAGLILGAVGVFVIERKFKAAAYFAAAGGVMTFFGMMHGHQVGIAHGLSLTVAVSYVAAAGVLYACAFMPAHAPAPAHGEVEHAPAPAPTPKPAPVAHGPLDDDLAVAME